MKGTKKRFFLATAATLILSCPAQAEELKYYPTKSFTVTGEYQGTQTGTFAEHVDRYGHMRVEINKYTMNMMGISQSIDERLIHEGKWITRVDMATRRATRTPNPMYESISRSVKERGGVETGEAFIRGMGGSPTGKGGEYAGAKCNYWAIPSLGSEMCVTDDGITLYSKSNMAGMEIVRVATKVKRGDPGPKEVYLVPSDIPVSEGGLTAPSSGQRAGEGEVPPNIQEMLDGFMKGQ